MRYTVKKVPGLNSIYRKLRYYLLNKKREVNSYKTENDIRTSEFRIKRSIKGDFSKTFIKKSYFDKEKNIKIFKETEIVNGKKTYEIIVKKDETAKKIYVNILRNDKIIFYEKEYSENIAFMLRDNNIIFSLKKDFINLENGKEIEENNINIPKLIRIKKLN